MILEQCLLGQKKKAQVKNQIIQQLKAEQALFKTAREGSQS